MKLRAQILSYIFLFVSFSSSAQQGGTSTSTSLIFLLLIPIILFFMIRYGRIRFRAEDFKIVNKIRTGIICATIGIVLSVVAATLPIDPGNKYQELSRFIPAYKLEVNKIILVCGLSLFLIGGVFIAIGVSNKPK